MRLDKFLADCGAGTRSEIKKLIKRGMVEIEGMDAAALKPDTKVSPESRVFLGGEELKYREHIYLALNKPAGYISATYDKRLPVVLELVPERFQHFKPFPMGRLDIDAEGLLIITDDGALAHELLSPAKHVPKTYYVEASGSLSADAAELAREGLTLEDGYVCAPAKLKIIDSGDESGTAKAEIEITEGKFHQVKRMFSALGCEVKYLKRIRINGLELDPELRPGEIRELGEDELERLKNGGRGSSL